MTRESVLPGRAEFLEVIEKTGAVPPLHSGIPYISPHELYPAFSGRGSILFESVKGPHNIARYSFVIFEPYAIMRVKDGYLEIEREGVSSPEKEKVKDPLQSLKGLVGAYRQRPDPGLPPFQGGAAGLLCYDFAGYIEKSPDQRPPDELGLPDACFFMADRLLAFDHMLQKAWAIVCPGARAGRPADWSALDRGEIYGEAAEQIWPILERVSRTLAEAGRRPRLRTGPPWTGTASPAGRMKIEHEMSEAGYVHMVRRAKEYIAAGDIFQANLSLRVRAGMGGAGPWDAYCLLRGINPSPFAAFMDFGDFFIAGSSPERLIKLAREGAVETRPIAGTRPRGRDEREDVTLRTELLLNEKERAEHTMLIDLERNDIGRVAEYGSVEVDELMTTEDYSHVMHIVSNIRGRLAVGKDMFDCLRAVFPGGTITGVPKVRCMEIINELEPARRGPYTGSAGYFGFSGAMDMNIVIRTFLIKDGTAYVQAGAGIVADSVPEREYRESLKKAEALLLALKRAGQGSG